MQTIHDVSRAGNEVSFRQEGFLSRGHPFVGQFERNNYRIARSTSYSFIASSKGLANSCLAWLHEDSRNHTALKQSSWFDISRSGVQRRLQRTYVSEVQKNLSYIWLYLTTRTSFPQRRSSKFETSTRVTNFEYQLSSRPRKINAAG